MPGFGTLMAGRRVTGFLQAALGVLGLALTMVYGVRFLAWYVANWTDITGGDDPIATLSEVWLRVRWAMGGIGVFLLATLWALSSSLSILREAKANATPPPVMR